jgi:hypothetical protein
MFMRSLTIKSLWFVHNNRRIQTHFKSCCRVRFNIPKVNLTHGCTRKLPYNFKGLCCWHVSKNESSWVSFNNIGTTTHIMVEWSNHLLLMCSMMYLMGSKSQDNKPPSSWKIIWIEFFGFPQQLVNY